MTTQQEQFERRYAQISQTDRPGWSDEETCQLAIRTYRKLLESFSVRLGHLLELGCGRGNIALDFAENGWQITGIDFSPTAIAWAEEFAQSRGLSGDFLVADLRERWPVDSQQFDVVIDANCMHFMHGTERTNYFSEAKRVLKPDGTFVISSSVNQPDEEHWEMLGYDSEKRVSIMDGVVMNIHVDAHELIQEVGTAGFKILASVLTKNQNELLWIVAKPT